jgi:hypothetical protein
MNATVLESTALARVAYDARRELLHIEFRDQTIHEYFGVPSEVHDGLLRADSKGAYFNKVIRGRYNSSPVPNALPVSLS